MSWTQDRKVDSTGDDRLYRSFTVLPATMYVRSDQLQTGTMYPHRALWGDFKGELPPLTPFSLGYRFFWARKRNGNNTPPLGGGKFPRHGRRKICL